MDREDLDSALFASPKVRSNVDSGKGVRIQVPILTLVPTKLDTGGTSAVLGPSLDMKYSVADLQGGRVYDSKLGVTCHWYALLLLLSLRVLVIHLSTSCLPMRFRTEGKECTFDGPLKCCFMPSRCRQKTLENKVTCTDPGCGKGRRLPTSFWYFLSPSGPNLISTCQSTSPSLCPANY